MNHIKTVYPFDMKGYNKDLPPVEIPANMDTADFRKMFRDTEIVKGEPRRFPPEVVRKMHLAKYHKGKVCEFCEGCKTAFVSAYIKHGWAGDLCWPKAPKAYCKDCCRTLKVRRVNG